MRYLLIGNAENCTDAVAEAATRADIIVQINTCRYAELLPRVRANYVFVTNSGSAADTDADKIMDRLLSLRARPVFHTTRLILARNPAFYTLKKYWLCARRPSPWRAYNIQQQWRALRKIWPMQSVALLPTVRLEREMRMLGMAPACMPSTGMIAYDWVRRRLEAWDYLFTEGFTFEGWAGHPWAIERQLIKPIMEERARG
jgi:hypothetical protein